MFKSDSKNIENFLRETFLKNQILMQLIVVEDEKIVNNIELPKMRDMCKKGIVLDSYMNGIEVLVDFDFDNLITDSRFSDFCKNNWMEEFHCGEFNYKKKEIYLKDLTGDELKPYTKSGNLLIVKIEGIKKEKINEYKQWKYLNRGGEYAPLHMKESILFPIIYDEKIMKVFNDGGHSYGGSEITWTVLKSEDDVKLVVGDVDVENIIRTCDMLEFQSIELGITNIIEVGGNRYLEYRDYRYISDEEDSVYWHGIRLENEFLRIYPEIKGVYRGNFVVNVLNDSIVPNVARDSLMYDEEEKIERAILRAIYLYIIENIKDIELKKTLQKFVDDKYPNDNPYSKR